MVAVISHTCFYDEIERAAKSINAEIIYKALDSDIDITSEIEKILRIGIKCLILDISAVEDQNKIPAAIRKVRILKGDARVILIAPNMTPGNPVISQLVTMGIYDIVSPKSDEEDNIVILPDLLESINNPAPYSKAVRWEVGAYTQEDTVRDAKPPEVAKEVVTIIKDKIIGTVIIGVAGAHDGVGCTHTALSISFFLARQKDNNLVACLDMCDNKDMRYLNVLQKVGFKPNSFEVFGVDFYGHSITLSELIALKHYNYIVLDIGVLKRRVQNNSVEINKYYDEFVRSSVSLLVCGGKVWQDKYTKLCVHKNRNIIGKVELEPQSWKLMYNFIDSREFKDIAKGNYWSCYNIPYNTDIFSDDEAINTFYADLLKEVLPESSVQKKKRRRLFG